MRRLLMLRRSLPLLLTLAGLLATATAQAQESGKERYFYQGYDYGSQAEVSPMWVFVNRGFDVLQIHVGKRNIFDQSYGSDARNVADNLVHAPWRISDQGWGKFVSRELLPLSFGQHTARWVPNYTLHLLGGGMEYTMLREWFEDQGAALPGLWSGLTLMSAAFLNETLENKGAVGRNTDCIADIYFFDLGAILLFSFRPVNRFFSRELVLMDWSKQPAFTLPSGELHNQGNNFAAKWALPFWPRMRLFVWFGMSTTGGLSYLVGRGYSVSAAGGMAATRLSNQDPHNVENTVQFAPTAAVFLDRNNSLLASFQWADVQDYFLNLNVYPGLVRPVKALGLWAAMSRNGGFVAGFSSTWTFGLGAGKL